eukprot:6005843-Alexandrium_andersonii.AAC.1
MTTARTRAPRAGGTFARHAPETTRCAIARSSRAPRRAGRARAAVRVASPSAVSYTHLTLPTICSV